jgi:hypothetical protein
MTLNAKNILLTFLSLLIVGTAMIAWWLFLTTPGGLFLTHRALKSFSPYQDAKYECVDGNLIKGLTFKNLEFKGVRIFRQDVVIRVGRLMVRLDRFDQKGIVVAVENGRCLRPDAEPLIFQGRMAGGRFHVNVFTKGITDAELAEDFFIRWKKKVAFELSDVDVTIDGDLADVHVKGAARIGRLQVDRFSLSEAPAEVDGDIRKIGGRWRPFGDVFVTTGEFQGTKTALIHLSRSQLHFEKHWKAPVLNIKGNATVEQVNIDITIRGTFSQPDIILASQPPYPKERLLLMLATNRAWSATEKSFQNGQMLSANAAKEFVDYFLFQGNENSFVKALGIRDIDVQFDRTQKGVKVTKEVTGHIDAIYGVSQTEDATNPQNRQIKQKIGGEYRFNDRISAGFEKEILPLQTPGAPLQIPDDRLILRFQGSF